MVYTLSEACLKREICRYYLFIYLRMFPVRSEVLTAVLLKIQAFWDVTPCQPVKMYQRFEGSWCLHLQDLLVHHFPWTN